MRNIRTNLCRYLVFHIVEHHHALYKVFHCRVLSMVTMVPTLFVTMVTLLVTMVLVTMVVVVYKGCYFDYKRRSCSAHSGLTTLILKKARL